MLDDLKLIHEKDAQDALGVAEKQWQQLEHEYDLNVEAKDYQNVVVAGMGGSALAAHLSTTWPGYKIPFEICRDYEIPSYVSAGTLFIASSYSGNTEETLEALSSAEERGATIVVVSSGGKLAAIAQEKGYPLARLPDVGQPRFGALAGLKALVTIFASAGLIDGNEAQAEISAAVEHIKQSVASWVPTVPTSSNQAKQLAQELMGSSPVVYAGKKMYPAAYKWKISFNENAKNVAWCNVLPEFNHNEFLGWTSHPTDKPYKIIDLRSSFEHERVKKRFDVSDRLLSGKRPAALVVDTQGDTLLKQLVWTVALGDFVSLYLAILNGLNPTPVDLIEKFKTAIND